MAALLGPGQRPGTTRTLQREADGGLVRRSVLPGGVRVITEAMPTVRSVALGLWVGVGSRDETPRQAGSAHFLEHLLFKGTSRRDALDISAALDDVGGEMNAFTSKEYTCYYARVLDRDVPVAVDVLVDMVTSSLIRPTDVQSERGVILEEIAMHDDDPDDVVHDEFASALFGDTDLGRPVLGTVDTISGATRGNIHRFYGRNYRPEQIVVAAAGNLDHRAVVRLVRAAFDRAEVLVEGTEPVGRRAPRARSHPGGHVRLRTRETEQANVVIGVPGVARDDDRRFALGVLNAAFGGGMSSRLFQEVREKRGLAYSVYSFTSSYTDAGLVGVYAGCQPAKLSAVLDIVSGELARIAAEGIADHELRRAKAQLRGATVLGLEDTGSRMTRLGKGELNGELPAVDEVLARIDALTVDDVRDVAGSLLSVRPTLAVLGPFDDPGVFHGVLG